MALTFVFPENQGSKDGKGEHHNRQHGNLITQLFLLQK
jgi:hypothetical protein